MAMCSKEECKEFSVTAKYTDSRIALEKMVDKCEKCSRDLDICEDTYYVVRIKYVQEYWKSVSRGERFI